MCLLTVFTPTYNRAYLLSRTYKSLVNQDCKDFIWMIIDDGSTDNTRELVEEWKTRNNGFEIQYIYKENGGMHTAHNVAYENITTELNVCIDSDDAMAEGAVKKIVRKWEAVKENDYAGIIGLDADFAGRIIGKGFPAGMTETTLTEYYNAGGSGDMKLIYRTDIIKRYPAYPVFEGEKFVALSYKYRLIDKDYKLAVLDDVLCNVEYQEDGSTRNMVKQYYQNPKGFAFIRKFNIQNPPSGRRMFIDYIHYVSSSILSKNKHFLTEAPRKVLIIAAIPFGVILTAYIIFKNKKSI